MPNRVTVDKAAIDALSKDPAMLAALHAVAEAAAERMRQRAPTSTGAGAASIHAEPDPDGESYRVGWDRDHFYMSFVEFGTESDHARPFARPTVDEFNRH